MKNTENGLRTGLVHYYYGNGKGKTTSIIGGLLRALGHELKPILIQFLKRHNTEANVDSGYFMGEIHFLKDHIPIKQFGRGEFINPKNGAKLKDKKLAKEGLNFAREVILSGKYDLVAMDEVVDAIALNLIKIEDLIKIVENKPNKVEVLLSGYKNYQDLIDLADYVTDFGMVKHPYNEDIEARPGIEF